MAHVDPQMRSALGLAYNPNPDVVRSAMLRAAGVQPPTVAVLARCDDWFVTLANGLASLLENPVSDVALSEVADSCAAAVHVSIAPAVLAIIAPQIIAPTCAAGALPAKCKEAIRQELPGFCTRVLAHCADEGSRQ